MCKEGWKAGLRLNFQRHNVIWWLLDCKLFSFGVYCLLSSRKWFRFDLYLSDGEPGEGMGNLCCLFSIYTCLYREISFDTLIRVCVCDAEEEEGSISGDRVRPAVPTYQRYCYGIYEDRCGFFHVVFWPLCSPQLGLHLDYNYRILLRGL